MIVQNGVGAEARKYLNLASHRAATYSLSSFFIPCRSPQGCLPYQPHPHGRNLDRSGHALPRSTSSAPSPPDSSLRLTLLPSRSQLIVNNNLPSPCMQFGPFYAEGKKDEGELESSKQLQSLFSAVEGIEAEVVEDMQTARWTKVIWVSLAVLQRKPRTKLTSSLSLTTTERRVEPYDGSYPDEHRRLDERNPVLCRLLQKHQYVPYLAWRCDELLNRSFPLHHDFSEGSRCRRPSFGSQGTRLRD